MYDSRPNGRPTWEIFLEDIISERKLGKNQAEIAKALTKKYITIIKPSDINNFLQRLDPPKRLRDFDSPERHRYKLFTLDDIITERKKVKNASEIAEALTEKYKINITKADINTFLQRLDPPKRLRDFGPSRRERKSVPFTLEDIISERKKGKVESEIAEALTEKYKTTITSHNISYFLKTLDPPKRLRDFDSPEKSTYKQFTLEDIISERKKGKTGSEIAEALTGKYGIIIKLLDIENFLRSFDPPKRLRDFDPPNKNKQKIIILEDIISEREKKKSGREIAEALTLKYGINITEQDIQNFLRSFDPPKKLSDFGPAERIASSARMGFTLEDIISEREKKKSGREIAEALTEKYGTNITLNDINSFLRSLDQPKGLKDFDSTPFTLEDIISERKKQKTALQIAEALTLKYDTTITDVDIRNFLKALDPPKKLSDFDPPGYRQKFYTRRPSEYLKLGDIIAERKKKKKGREIAEALTLKYGTTITEIDIYNFLKRLDPPMRLKDFDSPTFTLNKSRSNPLKSRTPFQNTVSTSIGLGSSMAIAKVLDMKYPTMSGTKRSLIAGGVPAGVSLGIYAKTKDEAALWGLAGSVIGTALSAYIFRK